MKKANTILAVAAAVAAAQALAAGAPKHTVTFRKLDGTVLKQVQVAHGGKVAYATKSASASAANPAPLSVPKANGKPSGVHTNQALCATVKW